MGPDTKSSAAPPGAHVAPSDGAGGGAPLSWRSPALLAALLATLLGQIAVWTQLEGYPLADAVEYLDRAQTVARGEPLDPGTVRSFAFSALLVPIFLVQDTLGLGEPRAAVWAAQLLQMAFAWLAVLVVARTAARLAGRAAGLGAAFLLALNPILLQYSVAPLAGTAALLAVALATDLLARPPSTRRAFFAGCWLGVSILMAFQCLPVVGVLGLSLLGRRGWRRPRVLGAALAGLALLLLVQGLIDLLAYGTFASSLAAYARTNFGGSVAIRLHRMGFQEWGVALYDIVHQTDPDAEREASDPLRALRPRWWYFQNLHLKALVWPAVLLVLLGIARALGRLRCLAPWLLLLVAVNVFEMSERGSKSFRLWMPILPALAVLGGLGFGWLWGAGAATWAGARRGLALVLLAGVAAMLPAVLSRANLAKYGGYWRAMERIQADAERPARVASTYHWAVQFRETEGLELVKLPYHLDRWPVLDERQRESVLEALGELDWFVSHLQALDQDARVLARVNAHFEVVEVIDDRLHMEELEPIYVLRRRTGRPDARTFHEVFEDTGPGETNEPGRYQARLQHPISVDFRRRDGDGRVRQMVFLGFDVETSPEIAGGTQAWITYHWYAGPLHGTNYRVVDRFTDGLGGGWNNNRMPTRGAHPTSEWREGTIVRESFLTRFPAAPADFGGAWRRGAMVPVQLWMGIAEYDEEERLVGGLNPFRPSTAGPIARSGGGRRFSSDGLMLLGGFFWPLPPEGRLPDDGRPFPGER